MANECVLLTPAASSSCWHRRQHHRHLGQGASNPVAAVTRLQRGATAAAPAADIEPGSVR